eukprot:m.124991 g.124991  ORF g.124991 m.124991 type:complete len:356 (-) comp16640_c2_seq1:2045-3112(-)
MVVLLLVGVVHGRLQIVRDGVQVVFEVFEGVGIGLQLLCHVHVNVDVVGIWGAVVLNGRVLIPLQLVVLLVLLAVIKWLGLLFLHGFDVVRVHGSHGAGLGGLSLGCEGRSHASNDTAFFVVAEAIVRLFRVVLAVRVVGGLGTGPLFFACCQALLVGLHDTLGVHNGLLQGAEVNAEVILAAEQLGNGSNPLGVVLVVLVVIVRLVVVIAAELRPQGRRLAKQPEGLLRQAPPRALERLDRRGNLLLDSRRVHVGQDRTRCLFQLRRNGSEPLATLRALHVVLGRTSVQLIKVCLNPLNLAVDDAGANGNGFLVAGQLVNGKFKGSLASLACRGELLTKVCRLIQQSALGICAV